MGTEFISQNPENQKPIEPIENDEILFAEWVDEETRSEPSTFQCPKCGRLNLVEATNRRDSHFCIKCGAQWGPQLQGLHVADEGQTVGSMSQHKKEFRVLCPKCRGDQLLPLSKPGCYYCVVCRDRVQNASIDQASSESLLHNQSSQRADFQTDGRTEQAARSSHSISPEQAEAVNQQRPLSPQTILSLSIISAMILLPFFVPWGVTPLSPENWWATVWALTGLSVFGGAICLVLAIQPNADRREAAYLSFGFTAFVGIFLLLAFQQLASAVDQKNLVGHWSYLIVRGIAIAYRHTEHDQSRWFLVTLAATFFSVALCEELLKAFPAIFLTVGQREESPQTVIFVGALSGLGFGVAEAIWYAVTIYSPNGAPFWLYVVRFLGCAPLHAVWASISAWIIFLFRASLRQTFQDRNLKEVNGKGGWQAFIWTCATPLLPSMALHSLYNSWVGHGWYLMSVLTVSASLSIIWLLVIGSELKEVSSQNKRNEV